MSLGKDGHLNPHLRSRGRSERDSLYRFPGVVNTCLQASTSWATASAILSTRVCGDSAQSPRQATRLDASPSRRPETSDGHERYPPILPSTMTLDRRRFLALTASGLFTAPVALAQQT